MLYSIGLIIGPPMVGAGMDALDPHGFAYTIAALLGVYAVVVAWRIARVPRVRFPVRIRQGVAVSWSFVTPKRRAV